MDITLYNLNNRKYTEHLDYWEELYFANPNHKTICDIEDFLKVVLNSILKILID